MSEMVEAVSAAIDYEICGCIDGDHQGRYDDALERASRAAIEAMREPIQEMVAALIAINGWPEERELRGQLHTIIDAALRAVTL